MADTKNLTNAAEYECLTAWWHLHSQGRTLDTCPSRYAGVIRQALDAWTPDNHGRFRSSLRSDLGRLLVLFQEGVKH